MKEHNIKLGVSLYSYQEAIWRGDLDLEGAMTAVKGAGGAGVEVSVKKDFYIGVFELTQAQVARFTHRVSYEKNEPPSHHFDVHFPVPAHGGAVGGIL